MLNLKSWNQEHPREPLLLLVVLCAVLTAYVYTASPEPHSDPSAQAKSTVAKTLPTAGPLLVEAPVFGRRVKPVALALSDDSGFIDDGKCTQEGKTFHMHDYKLGDKTEVCSNGLWVGDDSGRCSHQGGWWLAYGHESLFSTKAQCEAFLESIPRHSWDFLSAPAYDLPAHCLFEGQMWLTEDRTIHVCKGGKWQDANDHRYHPNPNDYWM